MLAQYLAPCNATKELSNVMQRESLFRPLVTFYNTPQMACKYSQVHQKITPVYYNHSFFGQVPIFSIKYCYDIIMIMATSWNVVSIFIIYKRVA